MDANSDDRMSTSDEDDAPPLAVPISQPSSAPSIANNMQPDHLQNNSIDAAAVNNPTTITNITVAPAPPPVPVLLLTGYLGAGKTTLVNYILSEQHGYRCAVLLNEIADTGDIEKALVREPEGGEETSALADWVQLENGCICCSVKNDMVQALEGLLLQRDRFDYVIIETTGLANPGPVAAALWTDAELESSICLDAIVTVVDARNVLRHLNEERPDGGVNEAQQQVAFADVVLLNKIDLVDESALDLVESEIAAVNADVAIVRCENCVVDLKRILHTGMYTGEALLKDEEGEEREKKDNNDGGHHHHHHHENDQSDCAAAGCSHPSHSHVHDLGVRTVTLHVHHPLDLLKLRHWLDELLWEQDTYSSLTAGNAAAAGAGFGARRGVETTSCIDKDAVSVTPSASASSSASAALSACQTQTPAPDIFRVKGLFWVAGSANKWVLQAVHELYDVTEGPAWEAGSTCRSKLVFIGRHLDGERLQRELEKCCCSDNV
jgi:G3E family GTPase